MCGRYTESTELEQLKLRFEVEDIEEPVIQRFNIAPTQLAPVIVWDNGRTLKLMRWGLIPRWSKSEKIGEKMINARAESITEKRSFKNLLKGQRCLVIADGFFEWRPSATDKSKIPIRIVLNDRRPFAFAGLWDRWKGPAGKEILSFTIITTGSNDLIREFHQRMPVILRMEDEDTWLRSSGDDIDSLVALLQPYPSDLLELYEVSKTVNSPRNDTPDCIRQVG
jgi:putative SOS response-associated peptidase YedK